MATDHDLKFLEDMKDEFLDQGSNLAHHTRYPEYHRDCLDAARALNQTIRIYRKMVEKHMRPIQIQTAK